MRRAGESGDYKRKEKFTVSVRGHLWSSARHLHESLQNFAHVIQRNARRLEFIKDNDRIERLQLARADGSDPEELDVDATLEDVLICMGGKQLVAIILNEIHHEQGGKVRSEAINNACSNFNKEGKEEVEDRKRACDQRLESDNNNNTLDDITGNTCSNDPLVMPLVQQGFKEGWQSLKVSEVHNPSIGLRNEKPSSSIFPSSEGLIYPPNYRGGAKSCLSFAGMPYLCLNNMASKLAASPLNTNEIAQFLVHESSLLNSTLTQRDSFHPINKHHELNLGMSGFQSYASPIPAKPILNPTRHPEMAILTQFLASHLKSFMPASSDNETIIRPHLERVQDQVQFQAACRMNAGMSTTTTTATTTTTTEGHYQQKVARHDEDSSIGYSAYQGELAKSDLYHNYKVLMVRDSGSMGENMYDKDESSCSGRASKADDQHTDGNYNESTVKLDSDLVFLLNRRSKQGIGTRCLKMSDLTSYFHLRVVEAAKKLGVSQTTLKKACRKFGLKRWPGRKVRSLESTIHGLEHTIATGQVSGIEELTEERIRSEVLKLQQEMNQLVNGTIPFHEQSPVKTADLYKTLYSQAWKSGYESIKERKSSHLINPIKREKEGEEEGEEEEKKEHAASICNQERVNYAQNGSLLEKSSNDFQEEEEEDSEILEASNNGNHRNPKRVKREKIME